MATYKITQTETHITSADSEAEILQLWNEGAIDGGGTLDVTIVKLDDAPEHTFTFLSGEIYDVQAASLAQAQERLGDYLSGESTEHVTDGETLTELISRPCLECPPNTGGWHKGDDVGITFESLKQAQNEAILHGVKMAMDYLEERNLHSGANMVQELFDILNDGGTFFSPHALYSTECEASN
jgi:hypothetical protein